MAAVGRLLLVILLWQGAVAAAADVTVLASGAIRHALRGVFSEFERATGHKVVPHYEGSLVSRRQMDAGDAFDVAIVSFDVDDLATRGRIAPDTRVVLGHTRVGVGVRKGAPKPDIGTAQAFKRTLLGARSVAYSRGSSGVHFLDLLDRLGIAEEMKPKLRPQLGGETVKALLTGEAEIAVSGTVTFAAVPGVELIGSLPPELQTDVLFTAGMSAKSSEPQASRELLRFLATPAAAALFKAGGLEPA